MNISQLLTTEFGDAVSVFNKPFTYIGRAEIELDAGQQMLWLYDDDDGLLCVTPADDELVLFTEVDEEIEDDSDTILFQNKEYEFSYEDAGKVKSVDGDSVTEEDDRFLFSDYQAQDGEIIRVVSNENTGEKTAYQGRIVSEDDLTEI